MKVKFYLMMLLAAVLLCGCKSDDDDNTVQPRVTSRLQVMTVFAPSQLGDMGYADRVMKGVSTLKQTASADEVEGSIIATDSVGSTRQLICDWAGTRTSANDGATYSRRLIVLTEPYMVQWLANEKYKLQATDEVLLLKATEADVQNAIQWLGMDGRVHGLNISAAASVKRFDDARRQYCSWNGLDADADSLDLIRLYSKQVMTYRDSIDEVITEQSPKHLEPDAMYLINEPGELNNPRYNLTAFQAAYTACGVYYGLATMRADLSPGQEAYKAFVVADLGAAKSGAELFLTGHSDRLAVITLMLDAELDSYMLHFSIIRYFDRAVADWAQLWLKQPQGAMPLMEKHGEWDGYCTDDIDANILKEL